MKGEESLGLAITQMKKKNKDVDHRRNDEEHYMATSITQVTRTLNVAKDWTGYIQTDEGMFACSLGRLEFPTSVMHLHSRKVTSMRSVTVKLVSFVLGKEPRGRGKAAFNTTIEQLV